ncbi:MAG: CDP-diacylglycerol--serine O-phosphatidyltransferase [Candidatus Dadabacteria bacterium]|nr:CDP-diacylglycerol--serine O-phosphatidyltransferase [Candidatus Dadabacteria bacterium]
MNRKKSKRQRVMPVLPNLFTTGNLFCGLLSIMTSIEVIVASSAGEASEEWILRRFWWAGAFLVISAFLDMLDGRLARFFNHESKFGLSYDSLSDLVSFGVAPGVLIYSWVLMGSGKIGLMAILFYVVCTALRLARFNVQSGKEERFNFTGLPSPAAAGLMIAPVMLLTALNIMPDTTVVWYFLIAAPVIGLLMVSNVSYTKRPYINLGGPFNALVVAAIIFAAVITHPEIMFICIVYLYAVVGLVYYAIKQLKGKPKLTDEAETPEGHS